MPGKPPYLYGRPRLRSLLLLVVAVVLSMFASREAPAFTSIAAIPGTGHPYAAWNYPTQAEADRKATKGCREDARKAGESASVAKQCKVFHRATGAGYGALVCGEDGCRVTTGYGDRQEAVDAAYEGCNGKYASCQTSGILSWHDDTGFAAARAPAGESCIPNTKVRQCSSSCTNGDCLVVYQNGCKVRVQVTPRFDPFTNQTTYPSPSC